MEHEKIQIQSLTSGCQDSLNPDVFQNVISKIVQDMEYVKTSILTNSSHKYHLFKLEII
jgi:hypothetical protein